MSRPLSPATRRPPRGSLTPPRRTGDDVRSVYLEVLQPALYEIGRRWEEAEISIAQEHLATATTQSLMARLAERLDAGTDRRGRTRLVACAEGELHSLGGRMVADFLDADGWDVLFVGALSPVGALAEMAAERGVDVVALSASLSERLPEVAAAVRALRALDPRPLIAVGGQAFAGDPPPRWPPAPTCTPTTPTRWSSALAERFEMVSAAIEDVGLALARGLAAAVLARRHDPPSEPGARAARRARAGRRAAGGADRAVAAPRARAPARRRRRALAPGRVRLPRRRRPSLDRPAAVARARRRRRAGGRRARDRRAGAAGREGARAQRRAGRPPIASSCASAAPPRRPPRASGTWRRSPPPGSPGPISTPCCTTCCA